MEINIIAQTQEKFKSIFEKLETLPKIITDQIETAKPGLVGLECTIKDEFKPIQKVIIPNNTTQITQFDDYIGVYCGDFFFKLPLKEKYSDKLKVYTYVFININKK